MEAGPLLSLDEAIEALEAKAPDSGKLAHWHVFLGMSISDVAIEMGISKSKADDLWLHARRWLRRRMDEKWRRPGFSLWGSGQFRRGLCELGGHRWGHAHRERFDLPFQRHLLTRHHRGSRGSARVDSTGESQLNGGSGNIVGDGLLNVGGQTARSQVQVTSSGSTTFTDFQSSSFGASSYGAGVPTNYQFWYRDQANNCSGSGFNFSNAWTVVWLP